MKVKANKKKLASRKTYLIKILESTQYNSNIIRYLK